MIQNQRHARDVEFHAGGSDEPVDQRGGEHEEECRNLGTQGSHGWARDHWTKGEGTLNLLIGRGTRSGKWRVVVLAACIVGAAARAEQFMARGGLWSDEAMLALNIVSRSYPGLTRPLAYDQYA